MNTAKTYDFRELENIKIITAYKQAQEELSVLRKMEKQLKDKIITRLEDGKLTAGEYTVSLKVTTARGLDTDTLRKELPELWDEYGKDTERKSLVII